MQDNGTRKKTGIPDCADINDQAPERGEIHMVLSGFLALDGRFTKCEQWAHLPTAEMLVKTKYAIEFFSGIQAEEFLLDHGYVIFYQNGIQHRFQAKEYGAGAWLLLSGEQKDFIIKHLSGANNPGQRLEMERLLLHDMEYQEHSILTRMEERQMYQLWRDNVT
ncbi:MAG: hypothetical protein J1E62_04875 [Lachnospiraceae bacterium]|nr:hypothetical protein [Lachnospiraceae bacterium]